ncbi:MAG: hypothetical protein MHMPM18_002696 [Marteilia pararefringens]
MTLGAKLGLLLLSFVIRQTVSASKSNKVDLQTYINNGCKEYIDFRLPKDLDNKQNCLEKFQQAYVISTIGLFSLILLICCCCCCGACAIICSLVCTRRKIIKYVARGEDEQYLRMLK